jgi:mono/diheme cytochrome c family protein
MMRFVIPALMATTLAASDATAAPKAKAPPAPDPALVERGKLVFTRNCAPCHGRGPGDDGSPMLPGTAKLEARYKGATPSALELRSDLNGDALRLFVRNGIGPMPMFRKTEVSDGDIDAVAAYLKSNAAAQSRK